LNREPKFFARAPPSSPGSKGLGFFPPSPRFPTRFLRNRVGNDRVRDLLCEKFRVRVTIVISDGISPFGRPVTILIKDGKIHPVPTACFKRPGTPPGTYSVVGISAALSSLSLVDSICTSASQLTKTIKEIMPANLSQGIGTRPLRPARPFRLCVIRKLAF
jgi:hypothetical protein